MAVNGVLNSRPPRPRELLGWGAFAGVVTGLPVGVLMAFQGMLAARGDSELLAWVLFLVYAGAAGAAIGLVVAPRTRGLAVAACSGVIVGLLGWLLFSLTVDPLLHGQTPTWSTSAAAAVYRDLVADLLHGGLAGVVVHALLSGRRSKFRSGSAPTPAQVQSRVVIVGGGFAGLAAAKRFERLALHGHGIDVTLISESNFLLFTPMLAEVASGALEPSHISAPIRAAVAYTRFRHGAVDDVDTTARTVRLAGTAEAEWIPYDQLILAVGSVPYFPDLPGVQDHALTLKDLGDAVLLREHVIALLEQADHRQPDPLERQRLLTFVVAGGGFAGAETIAELFDLVQGVLRYFPGIAPNEPRFVLIHSRDRILPELPAELGTYALGRLRARGIEFRLHVRVVEATAQDVLLSDGQRIPTRSFVWTAGNRPSPLVAGMDGEHAHNGALVTDPTCRVAGLDGVWAMGDCAQVPDVDGADAFFPPTAQHALRQGKVVADNIAAVLAGRAPSEFRFHALGQLVALGHRTAAADIRGHQFSGLVAWVLWRGIYLVKLPGMEKRIRVLLDWLLDLAFPRDIVLSTAGTTGPAKTARQVREEAPT